jgi:hypothetical protein
MVAFFSHMCDVISHFVGKLSHFTVDSMHITGLQRTPKIFFTYLKLICGVFAAEKKNSSDNCLFFAIGLFWR